MRCLKHSQLILNLILFLLLISIIYLTIPFASSNSRSLDDLRESFDSQNRFHKFHISHEPIIISSNADFAILEFPGNGTEQTPFIIEEYTISTKQTCIFIQDTDSFFIIRNCLFLGGGSGHGIMLTNVTNGLIQKNIIGQKSAGIILSGCSNNIIENNTISQNKGDGVYLYQSSENMIAENNISENQLDGIYIGSSSTCIVVNNTLFNNRMGLSLISSSDTTIMTNIFVSNGVHIYGSEEVHWRHSISENNLINGKPLGYFWNRIHERINAAQYGQVILANCTEVVVEDGVLYNTSVGIVLGYSTFCNLTNSNILQNSWVGIFLSHSSNNNILNTTIHKNRDTGILIESSFNNTVSYNYCAGIRLSSSGYNTVSGNIILGERQPLTNKTIDGIKFYSSDYNIVTNNTIMGNNYGIYLLDSSANLILNNTIKSNYDGLYFYSSSNNEITKNTVSENSNYGLFFGRQTTNNFVYLNIIANNEIKGARDNGIGNHWNTTRKGNYWSDYDGTGVYKISGTAGSKDYHPLSNIQEISETTTTSVPNSNDDIFQLSIVIASIGVIGAIVIGFVYFKLKKG